MKYINDFKSDLPPQARLKLWVIFSYYFGMYVIEHPIFSDFIIQLQYFKEILPKECESHIG